MLVTTVLYVKRGDAKNFVIVDAAMNDLVRPTLYDAHHEIRPVAEPALGRAAAARRRRRARCARAAIFSPSTASSPNPAAGDLLAVMSAGAYGAVQAGTYNSRLLVPEVLVKGDQYAVVRPRPSYAELIGLDKLPPWLRVTLDWLRAGPTGGRRGERLCGFEAGWRIRGATGRRASARS